jgi:uncharacterized Zn-finger protein
MKKVFEIRNEQRMQTHLISKELDNLLFLDVINEDLREQSKLISILISSRIQQSPHLNIYEEKKKLLLDTLNSQRLNEKNIFRGNLVSIFNFWEFVWNFVSNFCFFKKWIKLEKVKNDFSSNIENAKKSLAKVMNHRIEKLSTLLNSNDKNDISTERENGTNEAYDDNSCSSTIKVNSLLMENSNRFKVNSNTKFQTTSQLTIHNRVHLKQKRFTCDQCQMAFNRQYNMLIHKRVHTREKLYHCGICQKNFAHSHQLTRHERVHTGERPYSCDFCQKKFRDASSFKRHKRVHTGEKPFDCDICHMKFAQSSILTRHKRVHTGEKPYFCGICQKTFSHSSHLTRHQRIHTGDKPCECDICPKKFSDSSSLTYHKRNSHKIETVPM